MSATAPAQNVSKRIWSAAVAGSTPSTRPFSCHDTLVKKCVVVRAIAPPPSMLARRAVVVGGEQDPHPVPVENLCAPGPDGVGQAVGVEGRDDERARRFEQFGDLGVDHDGTPVGKQWGG